ncbi:MAG: hypothetical protein KIT80_12100 [Chitinophagaceae bacterium]|nr:hypothetical protein [Chitinophagaceae bacterium]MCW5927645.1 hypothetical protein [Chitinophagaceae bacterium]
MAVRDIADVIERLNEIIAQTKAAKDRMGYFAALYKRMTIAVQNGIDGNLFEDGQRMNRLDVCFARRYFDAYDAYNEGSPCSSAWQCAFDYCRDDGLTVIQHLILGVNTHINLDLAIAAAEISKDSNIDTLAYDFNKINDVIASLVDDVQECLCHVWFPMRMLTKIANNRQMAVLNFSIDKARTASWSNALLLWGMDEAQQEIYIRQMDATVCTLAKGIRSPGRMMGLLLKGIRITEYDDVARTIRLIDTTVVD